jgi:hypothetical protein
MHAECAFWLHIQTAYFWLGGSAKSPCVNAAAYSLLPLSMFLSPLPLVACWDVDGRHILEELVRAAAAVNSLQAL